MILFVYFFLPQSNSRCMFAFNPVGGSVVILMPRWRIAIGNFAWGLQDSHKRKSGWSGDAPSWQYFSMSCSSVGIHDMPFSFFIFFFIFVLMPQPEKKKQKQKLWFFFALFFIFFQNWDGSSRSTPNSHSWRHWPASPLQTCLDPLPAIESPPFFPRRAQPGWVKVSMDPSRRRGRK